MEPAGSQKHRSESTGRGEGVERALSLLKAENKKMKKQLAALRRYIDHFETKVGSAIEAQENEQSPEPVQNAQPKGTKCPHCQKQSVKSCQVRDKLWNRCLSCLTMWSVATSVT